MNADSTDDARERGAADHSGVAISPELSRQWSMQAELDVRAEGLRDPRAVEVGIALWRKGLVAGIRWCQLQVEAMDETPRVCSACGVLWPADAFDGDAAECINCRTDSAVAA